MMKAAGVGGQQAGAVIYVGFIGATGDAFMGAQFKLAGSVVTGVAHHAAIIENGFDVFLKANCVTGAREIESSWITNAVDLIPIECCQGAASGNN